ncbi:MAG: hypothetical protein Q9171_006323 [Xanthocarpia ochracea]
MGNSGSTIAGTQNTAERKAIASSSCPVDEEARKAWLEAARENSPQSKQHPAFPTHSEVRSNDEQNQRFETSYKQAERGTLDNLSLEPRSPQQPRGRQHKISYEDLASQTQGDVTQTINTKLEKFPHLGTQRVTSSIPRADTAPPTTTPDPRSLPFPEGSQESPGNWIYPSEKMFFDAMKRKSFSPDQKDMPAIVPIHNAVNERAWSMIKAWESSSARLKSLNAPCGGPKLRSFSGDAAKLSPKARVLGWVGYQAPFDRHDWVVERCQGGGSVEYVIDFYKGRGDGLAFYLDVRPKLNTWEGCRMRMGSWVGLA